MTDNVPEKTPGNMFHLKGVTYDRLKFATQVLLPGLATLYFAMAAIWGMPYAEQIVGSVTALVTFLGLFLTASSSMHRTEMLSRPQSNLVIDQDGNAYAEFNFDPERVDSGDEITMRVVKPKA